MNNFKMYPALRNIKWGSEGNSIPREFLTLLCMELCGTFIYKIDKIQLHTHNSQI